MNKFHVKNMKNGICDQSSNSGSVGDEYNSFF